MRIDNTYAQVHFAYEDKDGKEKSVTTLEEDEYPNYYHSRGTPDPSKTEAEDQNPDEDVPSAAVPAADENKAPPPATEPLEGHITVKENQRGVSFDGLFGRHLKGATDITVTDPYIRLFYQARNVMELLETIVRIKPRGEVVKVRLITVEDEFKADQQRENLDRIKDSCENVDIDFDWKFDAAGTIHARHIVTNNGWKILLDRGLDIFQHYDMSDALSFSNRLQQQRQCKAFEITFLKV